MALGFDARLKKEIRRRDAAILQMKLAGDATGNIVSQHYGELKGEVTDRVAPKNLISENPWISMLVGVLAGACSALFLKSKLFPAPHRVSIAGGNVPSTQKVVVEVVGATPQKQSSLWKPIMDAVMAGAPAVAAYAQQFLQGAHENGHGAQEMSGQKSAQMEQQAPAQPKPSPASVPASISRRTAPPPRENS